MRLSFFGNRRPSEREVERMAIGFQLNGERVTVDVAGDVPLLWVLREHLRLTGTKYGCGVGSCGACTVHVDHAPARACLLPVSSVEGTSVTTIEGLSPDRSHPLQKAWIEEQVPQCGYCQSGQIMHAAALLRQNASPSREDIVSHMDAVICRCGTYKRILAAVERAAREG